MRCQRYEAARARKSKTRSQNREMRTRRPGDAALVARMQCKSEDEQDSAGSRDTGSGAARIFRAGI